MAVRNPFVFGTDLWDPSNRFETSWLLSPWLLFFCRALIVGPISDNVKGNTN